MVYKLCPELLLVQSVQSFLSEKTVDKSYLSLKSLFPKATLLAIVQWEALWLGMYQQ